MEPPRYTEAQQFGRITAEYDHHECALWLVWADNQLVLNSQEAAGLLTYLYNLRYQIFNRQQQLFCRYLLEYWWQVLPSGNSSAVIMRDIFGNSALKVLKGM